MITNQLRTLTHVAIAAVAGFVTIMATIALTLARAGMGADIKYVDDDESHPSTQYLVATPSFVRFTMAIACVEIKFYGTFVPNRRVYLHAIDAPPARWRGNAGSSPLDGIRAAALLPRNDLVKDYRVHPTHWLISTQVARSSSTSGWSRDTSPSPAGRLRSGARGRRSRRPRRRSPPRSMNPPFCNKTRKQHS